MPERELLFPNSKKEDPIRIFTDKDQEYWNNSIVFDENPINIDLDFLKFKWDTESKEALKSVFKGSNALSTTGGIISAATDMVGAFANNFKLNTDEVDNALRKANSFQSNYNNFDDISNNWNTAFTEDTSADAIRGSTFWERAGNTGKAALSGAVAGAQVGGPWGAIIGGAAGLLSGIGGAIAGNDKAKREAKAYNNKIATANTFNQNKMITNANNIKTNQFNNDMANITAMGGPIFTNGGIWDTDLSEFNGGGSHEENPIGGIPVSFDEQGIPNLVEEGEVKWNDYVFSNRLTIDKKLAEKYKIPFRRKKGTFAEVAIKLNKELKEMPNDPIAKRGFEDSMTKLQMAQEEVRMKKEVKKGNKFAGGGDLFKEGQWLRFIPALGSGVSAFTDAVGLTNNADYSAADRIGNAARNLNTVSYRPVTNYMTYSPFDKNYYLNGLNSQLAATRSAIRNQSNSNRAAANASLLAADFNANNQYGDLAIKADQYNQQQRQALAASRMDTDKVNAELALKAQIANAEQDKLRMQAIMQEAQMRQQEDALVSQTRSSNYTNFLENLGGIGQELAYRKLIRDNPYLIYDDFGNFKSQGLRMAAADEDNKKKKSTKKEEGEKNG